MSIPPPQERLAPSQEPEEFESLCEFLRGRQIRGLLEIGSRTGRSFVRLVEACQPSLELAVSVDLPSAEWGWEGTGEKLDGALQCLESRFDPGTRFNLVIGNSQSGKVKAELINDYAGRFDFAFIDGDHTLAGVTSDYELCKKLVRPGGWIGFHDIAAPAGHNAGIEVAAFWDGLPAEIKEAEWRSGGKMGIGVVSVMERLAEFPLDASISPS